MSSGLSATAQLPHLYQTSGCRGHFSPELLDPFKVADDFRGNSQNLRNFPSLSPGGEEG